MADELYSNDDDMGNIYDNVPGSFPFLVKRPLAHLNIRNAYFVMKNTFVKVCPYLRVLLIMGNHM